jgi:hypothetical protein
MKGINESHPLHMNIYPFSKLQLTSSRFFATLELSDKFAGCRTPRLSKLEVTISAQKQMKCLLMDATGGGLVL